MTYQETTEWMFSQLPMYQTQGASAYKKDLTNALLITSYLGNPQHKIPTIHVAGTNGKGSTSHFLASILQEAGFKVGLYTSPHLKDFRERIKINGVEISEEFVCDFIHQHQSFFKENDLSFFEMTVGLAFDYFAQEKVDIAIIEVGLGGRLDATNVIAPLVSVITNIGLDHTQFLGDTLSEIATEKAGIIKNNIPVVIGEYIPETRFVFETIAFQKNAPIYFASDLIFTSYPSVLKGNYQEFNKKTVLQTIRILQSQHQFSISNQAIQDGFWNVVVNTGLQGRWQQIKVNPTVICDTAHNKEGLQIVLKQLQSLEYENLHLVIGFVSDKDITEILSLFPKKANYYFCKPNSLRGLDVNILYQKAQQFDLSGTIHTSVQEAYQAALSHSKTEDVVFIGGSNFVVAEIL